MAEAGGPILELTATRALAEAEAFRGGDMKTFGHRVRLAIGIVASVYLLIACGPAPNSPPAAPTVPTPAPGPSREPAPPPTPRSTTPTSETLETALVSPVPGVPA